MLALAIGLAALLIWAAFFFFSYRWVDRSSADEREDEIHFALQAAPWSDRHVESLLARNPNSPMLLSQYVANAAERQDMPEALRRADTFLTRAPKSPQAWLTHYDILLRAGREAEAVAVLRKAVRRMPRSSAILVAWAREAARCQDWVEAARRYARLRRRFPGQVEGYNEAAGMLVSAGRLEEAETLIAEGMERLPESWVIWHSAARLADQLGDHDEAIRRWEAMRARFPGEPAGYLGGVEALVQAGRDAEAVVLIRQARDFFPGDKTVADAAARLAPPEGPS